MNATLVTAAAQATTDTDTTTEAVVSGVALVLAVAGALILALLLAEVISAVVRVLGRRTWLADNLSRRARRPLRIVLATVLEWLAIGIVTPGGDGRPDWHGPVNHALLILLILSGAWLLGALLFVLAMRVYRGDHTANLAALVVAGLSSVVGVGSAGAISADFGFSSRSPSCSLRKSTESRMVLAVSRNSRIGSSIAERNSSWNPLDMRLRSP